MVRRSGQGRAILALVVLAAGGFLIRAGAATTAVFWFDEATMGLMGQDVLRGQFPFFFYGQAFMGAVDGYFHAVPFALLGESVPTLRFWAVLVSLAHVAVAAVLARRVFGDGRWAAAVALVPSTYLLKWAGDARLVYGLILVLTPLCLLLAMRAADSRRPPVARQRACVVLALVGGLCWWINLLLAPVLLACALVLAWRRPRLGWWMLLVPLAFVLGSAPVWLFAAVHGRLPTVSVALAEGSEIVGHGRDLVTTALPLMMGVPLASLDTRPIAVAAVAVVVLGLTVALGERRAAGVGRLLLGLVIVAALGTVLVTERGKALGTDDPRYLLPIVALLPVLLGGALTWLARGRPFWAGAVCAGLLLAYSAGVAKEHPALRSRHEWQAARAALARPVAVADVLAARGFTAGYTPHPDVITFLSRGRVTVSHFYLADDPLRAGLVDGATKVAYLTLADLDIPAGFFESLAAAGIRYERELTLVGPLFTGFRLEPAAYREISPDGWSATASLRPELAGHAIDRDVATRWRAPGRPAGVSLQIDLGRVHPVGMVSWLPGSYQEIPVGFRIETSADGVKWTVAREVPVYYGPLYWAAGHPMGRVRWGRVEARFPPRPTR